jgi:tetratricopeptide (TPR) repeat protein
MLARADRITTLMKHGREMLAAGHHVQAANDFQLAASLDPGNTEAGPLAAAARKKGLEFRVNECLEKAHAAEAMGSWQAALAAYRAAIEIDPAHIRSMVLASRAALMLGDAGGARGLAEQAIKVQPRSAVAHEALGLALEAGGQKGDARKSLERAVEIDPRLDSAKERLKKLRWSFL